MTLPLFKGASTGQFPGQPVRATSAGGTIVVANRDSAALNVTAAGGVPDPWIGAAAQSGSEGVLSSDIFSADVSYVQGGFALDVPNHANLRPISCIGWNYANFYHIWRGNNTVTQAPRIIVLGRVAAALQGAPDNKAWPNDDDVGFPDVKEFWVPLTVPGSSNVYLELAVTPAARYKNDMFISGSQYTYLQGCDMIMAFVTQVATFSNTQLVSQTTGGATISAFSSSSSAAEDTSYGLIGVQFSG